MMTQKMREYVDNLAGEGVWDKAHDLDVLSLPSIPMVVDGKVVNIMPGSDREATVEQVQAEVRKALAQVESGEAEVVVFGDSYRDEPDTDVGC